jgi:YD repeat-containing protein
VSHLSLTHVVNAAHRLTEDDRACYGYDAQNQLIQIDFAAGGSAAYAYDALGRRIRKEADGTVTAYVYDDPDILLEFDGAGALQARYGHGGPG